MCIEAHAEDCAIVIFATEVAKQRVITRELMG